MKVSTYDLLESTFFSSNSSLKYFVIYCNQTVAHRLSIFWQVFVDCLALKPSLSQALNVFPRVFTFAAGLLVEMEEYPEEAASFQDSALEKVAEKLRGRDSSSSDSNEKKSKKPESSLISALKKRLFSQKPVHKLFGGGIKCNMFTF